MSLPYPWGMAFGYFVQAASPTQMTDFAEEDLAATFQSRHISTTAADGFRIELSRIEDPPVDLSDEMRREGYVIASAPHSLTVIG